MALQAAAVAIFDERAAMEAEMQRLLFRLEDGFEKIARAAANGDDVSRWEDVWIELLSEYEQLHNQMAA
ncbi:MAG: hypothetical protein M3439_05070 [Chloroflexota bacterium]|nr:hypothetical protein [Chloroflexota bacterium]